MAQFQVTVGRMINIMLGETEIADDHSRRTAITVCEHFLTRSVVRERL